MPDPILVGRNAAKVEQLAKAHGIERWTTDLDAALANKDDTLFFDAATTQTARRAAHARRSPPASTSIARSRSRRDARRRARPRARAPRRPASSTASCRTSCSCPACCKLKMLIDSGFFGRILSVRGEFGYWVFEGDWQPAQRPSWNYRKEDGGGIILDMLCHWRYVLDNLFGEVKSVSLPRRHAHPQALGRERQALRRRRRRRRLRDLPARGRRRSRRSTARGARACAATISSPSTSTARTARRSPA